MNRYNDFGVEGSGRKCKFEIPDISGTAGITSERFNNMKLAVDEIVINKRDFCPEEDRNRDLDS